MPIFITPFSAALKTADLLKTNLANAVVHLYKQGFTPLITTSKTELEAQECDFTDYATKTITAWTGPASASSPGYSIYGGLVQWIVVTPTVANVVGGWWIENAAGDVMQIGKFDDPGITMAAVNAQVTLPPTQFVGAQQVAG